MSEIPLDLEDIVQEEPLGRHPDQESLLSEPYDIEAEDRYLFYPGISEIEDSIDRCRELPPEDIERNYFLSMEMLEVSQAIEELQDVPGNSHERISFIEPD